MFVVLGELEGALGRVWRRMAILETMGTDGEPGDDGGGWAGREMTLAAGEPGDDGRVIG